MVFGAPSFRKFGRGFAVALFVAGVFVAHAHALVSLVVENSTVTVGLAINPNTGQSQYVTVLDSYSASGNFPSPNLITPVTVKNGGTTVLSIPSVGVTTLLDSVGAAGLPGQALTVGTSWAWQVYSDGSANIVLLSPPSFMAGAVGMFIMGFNAASNLIDGSNGIIGGYLAASGLTHGSYDAIMSTLGMNDNPFGDPNNCSALGTGVSFGSSGFPYSRTGLGSWTEVDSDSTTVLTPVNNTNSISTSYRGTPVPGYYKAVIGLTSSGITSGLEIGTDGGDPTAQFIVDAGVKTTLGGKFEFDSTLSIGANNTGTLNFVLASQGNSNPIWLSSTTWILNQAGISSPNAKFNVSSATVSGQFSTTQLKFGTSTGTTNQTILAGSPMAWGNHGIVIASSFSAITVATATTATSWVSTGLTAKLPIVPVAADRIKITLSGNITAAGSVGAECDVNISTDAKIPLITNIGPTVSDTVLGVTGFGSASYQWVDNANATTAKTYTIIFQAGGTTPTCTLAPLTANGTATTAGLFVENAGPT